MTEKILCVDDEPIILETCQRALRKQFDIDTALSGEEGLALVASQGPYAVIVSDLRMPGMDGVQFLAKIKELAPDSVRIMLTGNADQHRAIEVVNEGNIFRFLTKPCTPAVLAKALTAGIQQYRLVTAEKELLEKTLRASIQILTDVLSLVNPTAFSRTARVRSRVRQLATQLEVEDIWQMEIAAMLCQVGCVTVPEEILMKIYQGKTLLPHELRMFQAHPQIGHDLIARVPRLESVAEIIAYQEKLYSGHGPPHGGKCGQDIPLGARILKLALDFDKLVATGINNAEAFEQIQRRDDWYDPATVEALRIVLASEGDYEIRPAKVDEFTLNMILNEDIVSLNGILLVAKGQEVTPSMRVHLRNFVKNGLIREPINVLIPTKKGREVHRGSAKAEPSEHGAELTKPSKDVD